jgi:predicted LPLAT superfamily acyltransferase
MDDKIELYLIGIIVLLSVNIGYQVTQIIVQSSGRSAYFFIGPPLIVAVIVGVPVLLFTGIGS